MASQWGLVDLVIHSVSFFRVSKTLCRVNMNSFCNFCAPFFVVGIILILAVIGWWIYIRTSPFHVTVNRIPGPKFYFPLIGNALDLAGGLDHVLNTFQFKWTKQYGEIYRIFIGTHCAIIISSPILLEMFLNNPKIIDKGVSYKQMRAWLGQGLITSSGDLWKSRRKLLTPAFHFSVLNNFVEVFNERSRVLCEIIKQACQSSTNGKVEMDVYPLITRCSLDVICETVMGTKINAQLVDSEYVKAVYRIQQVFIERFQRPWLRNPTIFSFCALGREQNRLLKILHGFTENVIRKRREVFAKQAHYQTEAEETDAGMGTRLPLLDLLLKVSDEGKVLSTQDIREEIDTFMAAGHDTTSSLMSWFLYSMASNPDCQEKVYDELLDVFGKSERDCTHEDIPNLKYLECCIKETLRIYPSAPAFERDVQEDFKLGEYLIPAGTTLQCLTLATHRNPEFFPDPLAYKPERFFPEQANGRHPYAYIPFSAGPRNCIGQRFALLESKVVLSSLLRRFKFELSPYAKPPILSYHIVLKSLNGINLVVSQR